MILRVQFITELNRLTTSHTVYSREREIKKNREYLIYIFRSSLYSQMKKEEKKEDKRKRKKK